MAPLTDGGLANYAIVGDALWYREPDQTWSSLMTLPATISASSQVRLVGDRYLVMQQGTGTASVATLVYYLVNGGVASTTPTTLAGAQIILPDGTDGALVGPYGFAAYTGVWGDATSAITLYQPATKAVTGAQTGYAIATVTATNGYQTQSNINGSLQAAFSYQAGTIDPTGMAPLFNKVTMAAGVANTSDATAIYGTQITAFYNGLTSGETPAVTYPLAAEVGACTLAVAGIAYQTQSTKAVTDSLGLVSQSMVSQSVQAYDVTQLQLGGAGTGYYARLTTLSGTLDGVGSTSTAIHCDQTGFPISRSLQVYNAAGTIDTWTTLYTYLWQAYDVPADLNLLSPVVQQVVQSTPAGAAASTIAINVQTWRQWSGDVPYWAPDRQYRGLKADASFTAWTAGTEPAATDFMLVGQVTARTAHGLPVVAEDSLGTSAAVLYDLSQTYRVATAGNAGSADIHWYGCEPYESTGR